ncbi:Uma2 family endonuclease [Lichenihabitans sp. Uapishka_5]|uniref:Uma2 family endonuclease n=1 Tax=Lichenihabitans sp. Uapishka_5 TaxID=3037302 RepID=UPI0029E7CC17|nr:Uma2 family endonuclease [Lichenihabitans sp. Uapishka_5]MDX7950088.1 Uma2 family endonuclease [Lichenihabitans sp. Uapishka_5]
MSHFIAPYDTLSFEDFEDLLPDRPHDQRWELIAGRVIKMMVGARWEHNRISQNVAFRLRQQLKAAGAPFHVFLETFYMKNKAVESATLPDVMVACGPLRSGATSVDNPVILVEVMSRGSAHRDRHEKWQAYRRLASLQHYVLIERDQACVHVFDRTGDAWASLRSLEGLDAILDLPALGLAVPLRDIYEDVLSA